ncbi:MAG TPA: DegT/DnrJ/EryC1/StrS family aminotransferase [bacterium]|nr:DegT/DnrJ/EryC1/StrS family aminotransferase [bacterium]
MIKLLVPTLPTTDSLIPYLRRIEEAKWATNFGHNVQELESRLRDRYPGNRVVTVSSCTTGLEIVYKMLREAGLKAIALPALTFPATILAAANSGLNVHYGDVDKETWAHPNVALYGTPADGPMVDAAAAFGEQLMFGDVPKIAVFSMHATKMVGAGEGGYIVCKTEEMENELRMRSNFGMLAPGTASIKNGTNGKMSEYTAAVALASLDAYDRESWVRLYDLYEEFLPSWAFRPKRPRGAYPIMSVGLPVDAVPVQERMKANGVETRQWYCPAMDRHPLSTSFNYPELPVTRWIERHSLGLPYYPSLTRSEVEYVCQALSQSVES